METIPLILGASAVVFGLLALLLALMGKLAAQRLVQDVEAVRQQALQAVSSQWIRDRELESQLKTQMQAHEVIQHFKDRLTALLRIKAGDIDSAAAVDQIATGGRQLTASIDKLAPKIQGREQAELKRAGGLALEATAEVRSLLKTVQDPAQLGRSDREAISRLRHELSECQQIFRDAMVTALIRRSTDQDEPAGRNADA